MKIRGYVLICSLLAVVAHASPSDLFPLNGIYTLNDNTCASNLSINQQILVNSNQSGLLIHTLIGCTSSTPCDPEKVSQGIFGEFASGVRSDIGAEGLVVTTGLYARNNTEFASFENESNDTAGGGPTFGTNIVAVLFHSDLLQINYRGQYCVLKRL